MSPGIPVVPFNVIHIISPGDPSVGIQDQCVTTEGWAFDPNLYGSPEDAQETIREALQHLKAAGELLMGEGRIYFSIPGCPYEFCMDEEVLVGDIVQLNPNTTTNPAFANSLLTVTDVYGWGVQGYVQLDGRAYYRAKKGTYRRVGRAVQ